MDKDLGFITIKDRKCANSEGCINVASALLLFGHDDPSTNMLQIGYAGMCDYHTGQYVLTYSDKGTVQ